MAVVIEQLIPVSFDETRPTIFFRDDARLIIRLLRPLVGILRNSKYVNCSEPVLSEAEG